MFKRYKVKKGDTVKVISGGNRGKEGTVLAVDRKNCKRTNRFTREP